VGGAGERGGERRGAEGGDGRGLDWEKGGRVEGRGLGYKERIGVKKLWVVGEVLEGILVLEGG